LTTLPGGGRQAMCIRESDNSKEIKMSSITLEIRAAEGGDDAKLFVGELAIAYERLSLAEG
jgi:protein subunit release factor A